jgi:hypothetical protein
VNGSPSAIITMGYGTGTFNGSPSLVVTLGYGVGEVVVVVTLRPTLFAALPSNKGHVSLPANKGHLAVPDQI